MLRMKNKYTKLPNNSSLSERCRPATASTIGRVLAAVQHSDNNNNPVAYS